MADMTALPFPDASFDVVVAVHVFHLVRAWRQAVDEVLRVLRPGGVFLHCWDERLTLSGESLQERWVEIVRELGSEVNILGAERRGLVSDYLRERGFSVEVLRTVIWEKQDSPQRQFEDIAQRIWSRTWLVPDDIFAASVQRLESWAKSLWRGVYDAAPAEPSVHHQPRPAVRTKKEERAGQERIFLSVPALLS